MRVGGMAAWATRLLYTLGAVLVVALACALAACTGTRESAERGVHPSSDAASDGPAAPRDGAGDVVSPLDAAEGSTIPEADSSDESDAPGGSDASDGPTASDASDASDAPGTPTVDSILIAPSAPSAPAGLTQQLSATAHYTDGSTQEVTMLATWSSSDPGLASVDASGLVSAYVEGSTTVTAAYGGASGSVTFAITPGVLQSIQVDLPGTRDVGCAPSQAIASGTYSDGSTVDVGALVTWASSVPSAATVTSGGLVTAVAPGVTVLSATLQGVTGTLALTINAPGTASVFLSPNVLVLDAGATQQLTLTATFSDGQSCDVTGSSTFQTSAANVVTVSPGGLATGIGAGNATITGVNGGVSATASVSVRDVVSIGVNPGTAQTDVGVCPVQFGATATYTDGSTSDATALVAWTSSNPAVATIGAGTGLAAGVAPGTAAMSATLRGVSGTAQLTVGSATASSLSVSPATVKLGHAEPVQLAATVQMSDGLACDVTGASAWQSSAQSVATVSSGGLVTGVAPGGATVTASFGAVSGTSTVTVTSAMLTSIAIQPNPAKACPGGPPVQLHAIATYSDGSTHDVTTVSTWSSSNTSIATVGASTGMIEGVQQGTVTISAAFQGQTATGTAVVSCGVVTSISVMPASPSIAVGATQQFTATASYSDGSMQDVTSSATWSSSAGGVATVSFTGLATGVGAGSASITAAYQGLSGGATLTVH